MLDLAAIGSGEEVYEKIGRDFGRKFSGFRGPGSYRPPRRGR